MPKESKVRLIEPQHPSGNGSHQFGEGHDEGSPFNQASWGGQRAVIGDTFVTLTSGITRTHTKKMQLGATETLMVTHRTRRILGLAVIAAKVVVEGINNARRRSQRGQVNRKRSQRGVRRPPQGIKMDRIRTPVQVRRGGGIDRR